MKFSPSLFSTLSSSCRDLSRWYFSPLYSTSSSMRYSFARQCSDDTSLIHARGTFHFSARRNRSSCASGCSCFSARRYAVCNSSPEILVSSEYAALSSDGVAPRVLSVGRNMGGTGEGGLSSSVVWVVVCRVSEKKPRRGDFPVAVVFVSFDERDALRVCSGVLRLLPWASHNCMRVAQNWRSFSSCHASRFPT